MPIGGYFSLELREGNAIPAWYERAVGFMSARSALAAQLQSMNCERAYVPTYNCESVLQALNSINVSVAHYKLNANGDIPHTVLPAQNEVVLINNYFGLFDAQTQRGVQRFGPDRSVVDAAQALYYHPKVPCPVIYSPRKFFGLPDGGFLVNSSTAQMPHACDIDSAAHCQHLLHRAAGDVARGYSYFQRAESRLDKCLQVSISEVSRRLFLAQDFYVVAKKRRRNFRFLVHLLRGRVETIALQQNAVPLCCPIFLPNAADLRLHLAKMNIFCPHYWPGNELDHSDPFAKKFLSSCVFVPCDQRYDFDDMRKIAAAVLEFLDKPVPILKLAIC